MKRILIAFTLILFFFACNQDWTNPLETDENLKNDPQITEIKTTADNFIEIFLERSYSDNVSIVLERKENSGFNKISYQQNSQSTVIDTSFSKTVDHLFTYRVYIEKDGYKTNYSNLKEFSFEPYSVNQSPSASFTINPSSGNTATTFNFDASASNDAQDNSSVLQVRWDWENDGTWDTAFSYTKTASHQFSTIGTYTIKMEVKDSGDLTDTETKQVIVNESNTVPTASFTINPSSGNTTTTFNFDASASNDAQDNSSVLQVRWDWENDGTWDTEFSTTKTASHSFSQEGNYTVALKVKDTGGLEDTYTKSVLVENDVTGTVTDIDGNVYQTIKIGDQWWMAENLKVTHYSNGEAIPVITDNLEWNGLSSGAYCIYDNNNGYSGTYGFLYNWYAVVDSRTLAPTGWHLPTESEWQTLLDYLGGSSIAGGKLKEAGTTHWQTPNTNANNESGFSALPGGYRDGGNALFYSISNNAAFWSSNADNNTQAWGFYLNYNNANVDRGSSDKRNGLSIRCVQD